jgi:zinc/manganese transport system permease protein
MFELMVPAFLISVILVGIHSYLGIHILKRGVIFVDLSLAQIAALGAIVGVLFGYELHTTNSYLISLSFTFIGALIFSLSRAKKHKEIPQEAIIGIVYVVSAALSVLVMDRLPSETEHLKEMLVGNILFVSKNQIIKTFILYLLVGFLHYIWRDRFLMISFEPERAQNEINVKLWDFIFYSLFGIVVTSSVELAGVFLVFSFLIIPAVASFMVCKTLGKRLVFSWIFGVIITVFGLYLSAKLDTPTGATVVSVFGLSLFFVWLVKR